MASQVPAEQGTAQTLPALTPEGERFNLRQRQARMFALSPLVPEHLRKGSPDQAIANCWIALTLAEAMGEVPLIVMQNIHVVNGKAGFASQYMIARANSSGVFKGRIDWRIDRSDPANLSVTAFAFLRETGQEVSVTCDMKMAKAEQWTKNPKYNTMPEIMLRYRSAAFLVRFYAPDVMLGYQTSEEVEDVVAAAAPSQPALTAKMITEQAQPGETVDSTASAGDDEQQNPLEASGTAREAPGAEESTSASSDDDGASTEGPAVDDYPPQAQPEDDDTPDPAAAKADEIIAEIKAAIAVLDVGTIQSRYKADIDAMGDELAVKIEVAADKRKREIEEARKAAPAQGVLA
jgi:hypothetical protein